jgi:hypothetical protein
MIAMPVRVYHLFIHSVIKNISKLSSLRNFVHKVFALGFTKFPLDKTNSRLEFLTVLIKLSDVKCRLVVQPYKYNCIRERDQFYDVNATCFSCLAISLPVRQKQEIPCTLHIRCVLCCCPCTLAMKTALEGASVN